MRDAFQSNCTKRCPNTGIGSFPSAMLQAAPSLRADQRPRARPLLRSTPPCPVLASGGRRPRLTGTQRAPLSHQHTNTPITAGGLASAPISTHHQKPAQPDLRFDKHVFPERQRRGSRGGRSAFGQPVLYVAELPAAPSPCQPGSRALGAARLRCRPAAC